MSSMSPDPDTSLDERCVLVIDPDGERRSAIEEWGEEAIGRPIRTLDPAVLADELGASVSEAAAIVVRWELGGRPGLEIVEQIAHARPELPIIVADERPSRDRVVRALERGAKSVILHPFEAEELLERIGELPSEASEEEAPEDDGGAGDAEEASGDDG